jgi:glucose-6-phosphate isomerase
MIEVVLLAELMNINPFDQPGVELFKHHLKK